MTKTEDRDRIETERDAEKSAFLKITSRVLKSGNQECALSCGRPDRNGYDYGAGNARPSFQLISIVEVHCNFLR